MVASVIYNYQDKSSRKRLLPKDLAGQGFVQLFGYLWYHIYASVPKKIKETQKSKKAEKEKKPEKDRVSWYTENRFPIELRNLWKDHQNPKKLAGVRFGQYTNNCVLDFDVFGINHPYNDEENFKGILGVMEEIGLCRPIITRSSHSEGIHVYYFLPAHVHSFSLAATMAQALAKAGYFLAKGHLEIFPNPKPYNQTKITNFNGHRLPLQPNSGSYLLDFDYQPVSNDVATFVEQANSTRELQDMEALTESMSLADEWCKSQFRRYKVGETKMSGQQFRYHLEEVIEEGWTGFGQTNDLILAMCKYGIIFLALQGERLVEYIVQTAKNSPGYYKYCAHQHEIEKRGRDRGRHAENYPYTAYGEGETPERNTSYIEQFYDEVTEKSKKKDSKAKSKAAEKQKLHEETVERIARVVQILEEEGTFPATIMGRQVAIRAKSKELYNVAGSPTTLRHADCLPLWYPDHKVAQKITEETGKEIIQEKGEEKVGVNADSSVEKAVIFLETLPEEKSPQESQDKGCIHLQAQIEDEGLKPREEEGSSHLQEINIYEGISAPGTGAVGGENGSTSYKAQGEGEESEGSTTGQEANLQDPSLVRVSNSNPLDSLISVNTSNSSIKVLMYKCFLYSGTLEKSTIFHKNSLWILMIIVAGRLEGRLTPPTVTQTPTPIQPSELEVNRGACVSQDEAITTATTQDILIRGVGACNSQLEVVCDCSSSQAPTTSSQLEEPEAHPEPTSSADVNRADGEIAPQQWEEVRFKLQTRPEAKNRLKVFCTSFSIHLSPREREVLEQFLRYCLMWHSSFEALRLEAREWLAQHRELIKQIEKFTTFWEYFGGLTF